jgi:hypothetical protein
MCLLAISNAAGEYRPHRMGWFGSKHIDSIIGRQTSHRVSISSNFNNLAAMPGSFSGFGVQFLYPENWKIHDQSESTGDDAPGVMLETPEGAFFSLNRYPGIDATEPVIDQAIEAMRAEYTEIESRPWDDPAGVASDSGAELNFYYLDLLITARMLAIRDRDDVLLVQLQGESRDFDRLEPVFAAMLKSLRDSL